MSTFTSIRKPSKPPRSKLHAQHQKVFEDSRTHRQRTRGDADRKTIDSELADVLDDIDEVLAEYDAEVFVPSFIQKGGQ